jgi:hypothetical protein
LIDPEKEKEVQDGEFLKIGQVLFVQFVTTRVFAEKDDDKERRMYG